MNNPPCICIDVFTEAAIGHVDLETWIVEYEPYLQDGHVASCHHRSPDAGGTDEGGPAAHIVREHRIFARILNDMMHLTPAERFGRL